MGCPSCHFITVQTDKGSKENERNEIFQAQEKGLRYDNLESSQDRE